jgi:hypothetical protein
MRGQGHSQNVEILGWIQRMPPPRPHILGNPLSLGLFLYPQKNIFHKLNYVLWLKASPDYVLIENLLRITSFQNIFFPFFAFPFFFQYKFRH